MPRSCRRSRSKRRPARPIEEKAKAFAEHPIGSGPFMFESWQRSTEMVLKRNPHYWQKGEDGKPLPYLDEVALPDHS